MRIAIAFSLIFISFLSYSQRVDLKSIDPILCFNDKNGELTVIDDTNWINTYSVGGKLVIQSKILKKAVNFSELKEDFIPIFLHKKLHFVEKGCGRVLRFEKGNIERIDHSFSHRNQFNALVLEFNDTLYCVGGYGFFTIKDHVIYYDESLGQWYLKNKYFSVEHQIMGPLYNIGKNSLIVFAGSRYKHRIINDEQHQMNPDILEFSFNSRRWNKIGKLNPILARYMLGVQFCNKDVVISNNHIVWADFPKNKVSILPYDKNKQKIFRYKGAVISHRLVRTSQSMFINFIEYQKEKEYLKGKQIKQIQLYEPKKQEISLNYGYVVLVLVLFGLMALIIYLYKTRKNKELQPLSADVKSLLDIWVLKEGFAIELNDINEVVDYDNPEFETLKKRRDGLLKRLRQHLMDHCDLEESEVYQTGSNPRDKRIKLFILNPKVVLWYDKGK